MGKEQELLEAARTGNVMLVEKLLSGKRGLLGSGSGSIALPGLLRYLNKAWKFLALFIFFFFTSSACVWVKGIRSEAVARAPYDHIRYINRGSSYSCKCDVLHYTSHNTHYTLFTLHTQRHNITHSVTSLHTV